MGFILLGSASTILVHAVGGNEYHRGKACAVKWAAARGYLRDE